ncbi:MAG: ral secretion pathway protein GspG [Burkholderiaceae bacterium]|nr:ral secretion pathway protein GspG [Burkholderiaceae bacterium]
MHRRSLESGFTLIELVVTVALVGLVALVSVPLFEITSTRLRENELRAALREIRTAIDAYKSAADAGVVPKGMTDSGYPASLDVLVLGVDSTKSTRGGRVVFLRRVPRDPFNRDPALAPAQQWATRGYGSPPDDPQPGTDVFDVASRSPRTGLNGVAYKEW